MATFRLFRTPSITKRFFSTSLNQNTSIPTRHSRHIPPVACLSISELNEISQEVLSCSPGTLIPFLEPQGDDASHAWKVADATVQTFEWLIRGYSAQVLNTEMQRIYAITPSEEPSACIEKITSLIRRLEIEGDLYMDLRRKTKSQHELEEKNEYDIHEEEIKPHSKNIGEKGFGEWASPGETIGMFDTLLDTISVATDNNTPAIVGGIFERVNHRFEQDGGLDYNINPNTVPTQMTFNAALRAIANTVSDCEKTRDNALIHALDIFEYARIANKRCNAATYAYMVQVIAKNIPPSEMSGNLAHAFWELAKENGVIDVKLLKAMEEINSNGSEKYEKFMNENVRKKNIEDLPMRWTNFGKLLRYNAEDDTY